MSCARAPEAHPSAASLCAIFNDLFGETQDTVLRGGASEPLYEPWAAGPGARALISFREDYVASALHEVAHWCIAGAGRRRLPDYGYWYEGDGRGPEAQAAFVRVEARPQALEWCFAQACQVPFRLSLDNLEAPPDEAVCEDLARAVRAEGERLRDAGLPPRGECFFDALCRHFRPAFTREQLDFSVLRRG